MNLTSAARMGRRFFAVSALAAATALVAGCGGGTKTESQLVPSRFIAFGDGLSDVGQVGGAVYTIKDANVDNWTQQVAASYGKTITAQSAGGQGWARGNARIALTPDAAGVATTLTIAQQIDAFLAANTLGKDDVVLLSPGISDLTVQGDALKAGTLTAAAAQINAQTAGKALSDQVKRLVAAGGKHIVVAGSHNVGKSPYATSAGLGNTLESASLKFNESLLINLVNDGANVLYIDMAFRSNQIINQPGSYGFINSLVPACTTPTVSTCTTTSVVTGINYDTYVFADDRYFTPAMQRALGNYASDRMRARW